MFSKKPDQFPNDPSRFTKICEFARAGKVMELKHLFKNGVSVGQHDRGLTSVMLLASENNSQAMWLLINHFNASLNQAVQGAASGNHHELVAALLAEGASRKCAIHGYALFGNTERIEAELALVSDYQKKERLHEALNLLARGGHLKKMLALFNKTRGVYDDIEPVCAMEGCAYSGFDEQVAQLEECNSGLYFSKIKGYAEAGKKNEVSKMLKINKELQMTAFGAYLKGGFIDLAFALFDQEKDDVHGDISIKDYANIYYLASVGQKQLVEKELRDVFSFWAVMQAAAGYAENGDIVNAESLLNQRLDISGLSCKSSQNFIHFINRVSQFLDEYLENESIATRTMSFVENDNVRSMLLEAAGKGRNGYLHYGNENSPRTRIFNDAKNINRMMREDGLDFEMARKRLGCQLKHGM